MEKLESGQQTTESHTFHIEDNIHQLQGEFFYLKQTGLPFLPFLTTKQKHRVLNTLTNQISMKELSK